MEFTSKLVGKKNDCVLIITFKTEKMEIKIFMKTPVVKRSDAEEFKKHINSLNPLPYIAIYYKNNLDNLILRIGKTSYNDKWRFSQETLDRRASTTIEIDSLNLMELGWFIDDLARLGLTDDEWDKYLQSNQLQI